LGSSSSSVLAHRSPPYDPDGNPLARFILVTGGARSGKSRFAVNFAKRWGRRIVYLATCHAADREMRQRIARHQCQRPTHWRTIESPADPLTALLKLGRKTDGVILDCLTMYVSTLLVEGRSDVTIQRRVRQLCNVIRHVSYPVAIVTNEVGSSVVPDYELGRRFRDVAGLANQIAADHADQVVWLVAGIPVYVKGHKGWEETHHGIGAAARR